MTHETRGEIRKIEAVVFDYGGVLTTPVRSSSRAWMESEGIDPESYRRTMRGWLSQTADGPTPVHRLETGEISTEEFGTLLAAELVRHDGEPVEAEGLLGRLFAGMQPDPVMFDLVEELRELGVRTALLSNSWGNTYPRDRVDRLFDPVVISGEVGLRKPEQAIFRLTLERLGLPAERADRAVFVDDLEANVEGAREVGLVGLHHIDPATTRARLAELVPGLTTTLDERTGAPR